MAVFYQTTFLIPNLHCPTCVTHITSLMQDLHPPATVQNISTVGHVLTIAHDQSISAASIADILCLVGYEVYDIILDATSNEELDLPSRNNDLSFDHAVDRWRPRRDSQKELLIDEEARMRHDHHCQMCAAHTSASQPEKDSPRALVAVDLADGNDTPRYNAEFSVEGMTCSSCVGNVEKALQSIGGVDRADVGLVSHSASVDFRADDTDSKVNQLLEAVDDVGYDIVLVKLKTISTTPTRAEPSITSRTISLRVDGMHCPHCPDRVTDAVRTLDVDVQKSPTMSSPIITLSYTPKPYSMNVRSIIDNIGSLDRAFAVSLHKPLSVEDRSKRMLAHERKAVFLRALLSLVAAIPTLIIGIVYMNLVPKQDPGYQYLMHPLHGVPRAEWATFVMSTVVYFFATDHFHRRTLRELVALWRPRSQVPISKRFYRFGSMNMLISLGTTVAYVSSLAELVLAATTEGRTGGTKGSNSSYFDSVVFLTLFLLCGRLAEAHMKARSGDAVAALGKLRPDEAILIVDGEGDNHSKTTTRISVDLIDIGDCVKVPLGSSPACDGVLLDDTASFDESSLTGEARIVQKCSGEQIYSGTINKGSAITMRVTAPAGSSTLDSIIQVVREGQSKRAPVERIADLLTAYFVPVVTAIAIITWIIWLALGTSGTLPQTWLDTERGGWEFWSLQFAIAVFVIACPCGLGLAAPTALFVGSGLAAKRGILVKGGGEAFQEASKLDAIIFDKTGTLTEGVEPKVVEHMVLGDDSADHKNLVLAMLRAAEESSSHPMAKAAVHFCALNQSERLHMLYADEIAGCGIKAAFEIDGGPHGCETLIGNEALILKYGIGWPTDARDRLKAWKASGYSVMIQAVKFGSMPWEVYGIFATADPLRPEAREVVESLQARGVEVWMLSGDNERTAKAVGVRVGIPPSNVIAGVLPAEKADKVRYLQRSLIPKRGKGLHTLASRKRSQARVAMVGDGINDAPALATADVGIAVASGSDVAVQSASFILVHSDLRAVLTLVTLSRVVFRRVLLNFFWAAVYNIVAVPLAAGVLYPVQSSSGTHIRLDPAWAALAMALSSISVVASSLLLRTRLPIIGFRG